MQDNQVGGTTSLSTDEQTPKYLRWTCRILCKGNKPVTKSYIKWLLRTNSKKWIIQLALRAGRGATWEWWTKQD